MFGDHNWLSHGFKRAPSLFEAQSALGWGVVVALLALLGVVYLTLGSDPIISGYHIQEWTRDLRTLQQENTQLAAQIAAEQMVEALQAKAEKLGFVPAGPQEIEYLPVDDYPSTAGRAWVVDQPTPPDAVDGWTRWWRGLTGGFSGWTQATAGGGS